MIRQQQYCIARYTFSPHGFLLAWKSSRLPSVYGLLASTKESVLAQLENALHADAALQTSLQEPLRCNSCTMLLASSSGKVGTCVRAVTGMVKRSQPILLSLAREQSGMRPNSTLPDFSCRVPRSFLPSAAG